MHITTIKMKDGRELSNPIELFRPEEGYIKLFGIDELLYFKDMCSAVTKGERITATKFGDEDEIARAREYMRRGRSIGWGKLTPDTPKQEWE